MDPIEQSVRLRGAVHTVSQFLQAGEYQFRIVSPFDTQMIVSAENPVPGLSFVDQNAEPNVFNAMLKVPKDGQYEFKIELDSPVDQGELRIWFVPQGAGSGGSSGSGGNNMNGPAVPSPGWVFVYESYPNPTQSVRLWVQGGGYRVVYSANGQVVESFKCTVEDPSNLKCTLPSNPGLVQWVNHSDDWKKVFLGPARKFRLVRKERG